MHVAPLPGHAAGFTLIEVLLAMLILALGTGGIISMQLHALRVAQESGWQASAVQFAAELAEHLQADTIPFYLFSASAEQLPVSTAGDCYRQTCDPAAMAAFTINDWLQRLRTNLPQARVTVCRDNLSSERHWECDHSGNSPVVIKIGWTSRADKSDQPRLMLTTAY
jgi:type IV pilus assembly protein PilV